jgi:hypothetical protein
MNYDLKPHLTFKFARQLGVFQTFNLMSLFDAELYLVFRSLCPKGIESICIDTSLATAVQLLDKKIINRKDVPLATFLPMLKVCPSSSIESIFHTR